MIYGLNFNGTSIPPEIQRRFASRLKFPDMGRYDWAHLKGVCSTDVEQRLMKMQVGDGRTIYTERRVIDGTTWHGIYVLVTTIR